MKKLYCSFIISILIQVNVFAQDFWEQTNGPYSGQINILAVNSQGHIFAGTYCGLFRSTDNGENWIEMGLRKEIWNMRIDLNDQIYVPDGAKCFFSTDNGENWLEIDNSFLSSKVFAINYSNHIFIGYGGSIFRSIDSGQNWTEQSIGVTNFVIKSITINSNNQIFAGGFISYYIGGGVLVHEARIFRSSDNGETWGDANTGLSGDEVRALLVNSSDHIFAGIGYEGLFRSTDNGESWTKINGIGTSFVYSLLSTSNNIIVAGTRSGIFRSTDNGENWAACLDSLPACSVLIKSSDTIFAGTTRGIFRSTDYGNTWIEVNNGLTNDNVLSLVANSGNQVFAGSSFGDITRSSDNGETWTKIGTIPSLYSLAINRFNHIFVNTYIYGVYRSTDDGELWTKLSLEVDHFAFNSKNHIFASDGVGVFRSTNNGDEWTTLNFESNVTEIKCIAINSQDYIFIGGTEGNTYPHIGKVFRSTDNGENWNDVSVGLTATYFRSLEVGPNNNIYAATISENIYGDRRENVFCSTNNGETWTEIYNAGDRRITSLALNANNQIFIAIWDYRDNKIKGKVFRSDDSGKNWVEISNGLPGLNINSLAINSSGYIFAGTTGASVYRSINPTTHVPIENNNTISTYSLSQNYPNPFNPSTSIQYALGPAAAGQFVTLKVYDLLGREVATLVNEEKPAGSYEVEFSASNLASGIYFYRLQAGEFAATKKLILMK